MSTQYRLVQSGKTASGSCSASPRFVRAVAPRIYLLLNNWKVKQKGTEDKLSFAGDWHMKNNLINFGIDERIIF
jgi:hypothetical protein